MTDRPMADGLFNLIKSLDPERQRLVRQFITQIVNCHDPDIVRSFIEWRTDPCIDSLLVIAGSLETETRDQLLFTAEDLYAEQELGTPKASA